MTTVNDFGPEDALRLSDNLQVGFGKAGVTGALTSVGVNDVVRIKVSNVAISEILSRTTKKYIVPFDGKFYSYNLKLEESSKSKDLFRMRAPLPNIYREGMVVVSGEVYFVKMEDLKRGIVRKSRRLPIPAKRTITYEDLINGLACTSFADLPDSHPQSAAAIARRRAGAPEAAGISTSEGVGDQQPSGATGSTELDEELRLADLAYQEQIGALHYHEDSEEEWQDEADSQS